jgi:small neutral amino acid transporter SnatA (MarC family)
VSVASTALLLLLVMDPLGNVPFFLAALKPVEAARQMRVVVRELLIAYGVMVALLFAGGPILRLLQISEPALTIAGGIVLFLIALRMIFPSPERATEGFEGEPFIVPLAIPYVAGPSLMATELLLMSREPARWPEWWAALTVAWVVTAAVLMAGSALRSVLGPRGLIAMERLMGMVLVAVAVQMLLSGVERYVAQLARPAPA